ncbi:hypothetical protein [Halostella litorea]|uniref:hypothetical protein n=1 Tax=Halostella litorea TaxID=2528831 RepID=UPI0010928F29|nr:hypothetical protein [Halostella litorea]
MGIIDFILGNHPDYSYPSIEGSIRPFVIENWTTLERDGDKIHSLEVNGEKSKLISVDSSFPDGQRPVELFPEADGNKLKVVFNCPAEEIEIRGGVSEESVIAADNGNISDRMVEFGDEQERAEVVVQQDCILRVNSVRFHLKF